MYTREAVQKIATSSWQRPKEPGLVDGQRALLALLLSALLHALPSLLGLIPALALRVLPKPPIEFELLQPKHKAAAAAVTPPPSPPALPRPEKPGTSESAPPRPHPDPTSKARPQPPPSVQRLDLAKAHLNGLGPDAIDQDIGLRVVLRMPALRQSPHRPTLEALLQAFPDTHILAAGTPLATPILPAGAETTTPGPMAKALLDDVDALFIATADPRDISATVFYAVPRAGAELAQRLMERRGPRWDPRTLRALRPDLLAFARPDLMQPLPPAAIPPGAAPPEPAAADDGIDKLLATLRQPGPAVYAEILNVRQRLRLRSGLPTPVAVRLALSADADPEAHIRVELATAAEASALAAALPAIRQDMSARLFWLGLGDLLNGLKFQARGVAVEITGRLPRSDTAVLLAWVRQFLPPPGRFLEQPPEQLPEQVVQASPADLGSLPDMGAPTEAATDAIGGAGSPAPAK